MLELNVNLGQCPARQLKRVSAVSDREIIGLAIYVDEVLGQCELCRAFDKARRVPIAGTPTVSMFNGKLRADLSFLDDVIALRAMGVFPEHPLLIPARSTNHREVRGGFRGLRIAISGRTECIQMGESSERERGNWTDSRSRPRI